MTNVICRAESNFKESECESEDESEDEDLSS